MTNAELIKLHDDSTQMCSVAHHMRSCSKTYNEIISKGTDIIPDILAYLNNDNQGMNIIMLLEDLVQEHPYRPEQIDGIGFVSYNVSEARNAWLQWGKNKKML